jgi:predicted nucleic-acid-binding Zn-ribbon protein
MLVFEERTIKVVIDDSKCPQCQTKACLKGCSMYDRGILKLKGGKPVVFDLEEAKRVGTECLACEYECWFRGLNAIKIEVPISGLEEYRRNMLSRIAR